MATAKMKIILPLVVWTWLHFITATTGQSFGGIGFGIKREVFFLNLEDGYFGCQVNESTDVLQLFELSKLCDGTPNCYLGSDELAKELKCTDDCRKDDGTECRNGACLDGQCYCNDGYGGCSCEVPDENECKYRPCDVFAHCTNTLGSFSCTCFPGYHGDGFHCEDINECDDPNIAGRCVENAECCNLPAHFLCKCNPGFHGDGEVQCLDVDECQQPNICGQNALCQNTPGNYTCLCPEGFHGNPFDGCVDVDECNQLGACGPGATCTNLVGGRQCHCPPGYEGDPYTTGCLDLNECARNPCGRNALCSNLEGSFKCTCPPGFIGDPLTGCSAAECNNDLDCSDQKACINFQCVNPCSLKGACGENAQCKTVQHRPRCSCPECYLGSAQTGCYPDPKCSQTQPRPAGQAVCFTDSDCDNKLACELNTGKCVNPCERQGVKCKDDKKCQVHYHKPTCVCKKGFMVNERGEISCAPEKAECSNDTQCPDNRACIDRLCQNPCTARPESPPCAPDKGCDVIKHKPTCICLKNCSPSLSICLRDSGCSADQACRAFRCENPCDTANCPENTPCRVEDHKPVCEHCPPGYKQDPKYGCFKDVQCRSHSDCAPQQACINRKCQNPCLVSNPCTNSQDCQVQVHQPVCVKVCQCQGDHDCAHLGQRCDGCNCHLEARNPQCAHCPPGVPCDPLTNACQKVGCTTNEDCPISEACIDRACQRPCDVHNPCAQHAVCINTNHGCDCSCQEGYQGDGFVGCAPVLDHGPPVCQYNEDCPPFKLCDRLNRRCISPCFEDSCGDNAECVPKNHEATCVCLPGYEGNAYIECVGVLGCRHDDECATTEACINQQCVSPCNCGINAICDVIHHKPQCKCPPGYQGDARVSCQSPVNPCDPNPCGINALCELDNGNPICFCPKGLTGNPFKNCIPEGDECSPNPCGPNSGCRVVGGNAVCFCLPEYEGTPPHVPCSLPENPCDPSPCGPNTQCTILNNGFAKCTCLPGFLESPNTIRGCVEPKNPCEPNPCGVGALCDPHGEPVCYCPYGTAGNPFRSCGVVEKPLCSPGPCGVNADCYNTNNEEQCYCRSGFIGDPYTGCRIQPPSPCVPNPCGPGAQCIVTPDGNSLCRCPEGMGGDPTGPLGCFGYECVVDENCGDQQACISYRCRDPCPGSCGINAECRVEKHHPVCSCKAGLTGNPITRCFPIPEVLPPHDPCMPNPCGLNTICQVIHDRAVCSCLPDFHGDPQIGCQPECLINSDCPINKACLNRHCVDPCTLGHLCGVNAVCQVRDHTAACVCLEGFMGDPFLQCIQTPSVVIPVYPNITTHPCTPSPCGNMECSIYGTQIAICDPCLGPEATYNPQCRPECLTNADCPFHLSCLRFNCLDPCPGSCGVNAICSVVAHTPICSCPEGLVGDPFQQCVVPVSVEVVPQDTCHYQRCGVNADCLESDHGIVCVCRKGFFGDPYLACHPECVINPDCALDKACINSKCANPCTDVCGVGAHCDVVNHMPICYCPPQHAGDPFVACYKVVIPSQPQLPPANPCDPSPCGPFSRCLVSHQGYATCSCLPNYQGIAPACKPECISTSECQQTKACINQRCQDPCPGTCGAGALCTVINHNPICSCPPGQEGNPFLGCYPTPVEPKIPSTTEEPQNPCVPSPCGPNSICQVKEGRPVCSCVANYIGSPPYCRPECVISQECRQHEACVNEKCIDPCPGTCGPNAECHVVNHTPFCSCLGGYEGDAFVGCTKVIVVPKDPCNPSPCGENALCSVSGGAAKCACIPPYIGNPYSGGCRPECTMNSECPSHLSCLSLHCRDPCEGLCGVNAECSVFNHVPVCTCAKGLVGDPQTACRQPIVVAEPKPCEPSPCGHNSVCRPRNDQAICSCQVGYFGQPPSCRPECLVSSECAADKACINQKCVDPCPGTCGFNARCQVANHNPICSCPPNFVGDPFIVCREEVKPVDKPKTPCIPSPCGANAECQPVNNRAICSCIPGMFGTPPNCRPECSIDQDCPLTLSCTNQKCRDPCVGSCGFNAECSVVNHRPICSCQPGYEGDPFSGCSQIPVTERPRTPCSPSPCGPNAECREKNGAGACYCAPGFEGNPYDNDRGCRRECEANSDCSPSLACVNFKCVDPCPGTCGALAECHVNNHIPTCLCPTGYVGDPFFQCRLAPTEPPPVINPCQPSPCGPNSQCREVNQQAVCSCLPQYIGSPPNCRPECVVNSECQLDKACSNQRCGDPCPNTCGLGAQCTTRNHNPICACPPGYTGDPFTRCSPQPPPPSEPVTERPPSCQPSPCGPNSVCKIIGNSPTCSCLPNYIGAPPNCRPECVLSSECRSSLACINQKCQDPCLGSCGSNTICTVLNHIPICTCQEGFTGDAFSNCLPIPPSTTKRPELDPCDPSPCGPNAQCNNGICTCLPEYQGNPYEACRPECVLSDECTRDKACQRNKCVDPCPGTCGQNARCDVINHIPSCSCPDGYTGDPFVNCRVSEPLPPKTIPCNPSPCGPNSQCREVNDQAVCSCLPGYQGSPPGCRPECVVSAECSQDRACINQKCVDPCPGSCGNRARCEVRNHSPICSCSEGETGDPFQGCRLIPAEPVTRKPITEPCNPSPCGPNSVCRPVGESYTCNCLPEYIGSPPNCRPECVINTDCRSTQACYNNKCIDPCPGSCGENAECHVISHAVSCTCISGYIGDPFVQCVVKTEEIKPCEPSPCGANAECKERNGAGACICLPDYQGNPYEGCRPECVLSSDCPPNKACIRNKCADPCPGTCGQNAECTVISHVPSCSCIPDFTGDAFKFCQPVPPEPVTEEPLQHPCVPSPCGPNSQCREINSQAVCSCLPEYQGSPPSCKPECVVSSECPSNRACHKFKCANPCVGTCGIGAKCEVINHNPICSCPASLTGDPFTRCYELPPPPKPVTPPRVVNPCVPSPCGPNSECRDIGGSPSCSCQATYIGIPPNCRPECVVNTDCPSHLACITEKCRDPCPGSCGFNAECRVQNHIPICTCRQGYTGNAFTECVVQPPPKVDEDPCNPSPCGQNAVCDNGVCSCLPLYQGDPYVGCRPECTMNTDCSPTRACINLKCVDPCPGTCGESALCDVVNHLPICRCPPEYEGDPFISCRLKPKIPPPVTNPCQPSPCGPNSVCKVNNGIAVCSCQPGMISSPPQCRPECILSSECSLTEACLNNRCVDPCPGTCGVNALCRVVNHNPICSCTSGHTGDPFTRCYPIPPPPAEPKEHLPCQPSPCGPNAVCRVRGESPACSCIEGYVGVPPSCRPECTINPECPSARACINQKCRDPCPGSCGANALCSVVNHNPVCSCSPGHTGDPFRGCFPIPAPPTTPPKRDPCYPSPCGSNARCRVENDYAVCECLPEYHGNPYESCRPECLSNPDCPSNTACIRNKCQDPCPGTCGVNSICTVTNHVPVCTCQLGYTGDAFRYCSVVVEEPPKDPCNPSPCGLNTVCRTTGKSAICECLPGFFGNPSLGGCRPECTISSDCPRDKACVNTKCVDPCPGVCGFKAVCNVINHSPVCSCPQPLVGDPFSLCTEPIVETDPCNPSPCRSNGQCRVVNDVATCIYPECVVNPDCPRDKACYFQKCQDPCREACGLNAICQVVNHLPVCTCPPGFAGTPEVQCRYIPPEQPKPRVECTQDSDCANDKACVNNRCQNPCASASCGQNAECRAQLHRAICICRDGFTGNAQHACVEIGCRSDSDCAPIHACVNRECVDPCSYTSCGLNALCRADGNHKARCYCPESFRGNPLIRCERPECTRDEECSFNLACRNERCQDPCNCGLNAICNVINHQARCSCAPGYQGDPLQSCRIEERRPQPQCRMDADCPSKLACFSSVCKNPCVETKPCGKNAECLVVDSLPLRTMSCMCLPGYIGDADVDCRLAPQEEPGCKSNQDCAQSEACINRQCVNPCVIGNPCAPTAECEAINHKALCKCPTPLIGDPFTKCYEQPRQPQPECVHDGDCSNDKSCVNKRCQDPCALSNPCGTNAECHTRVHRPICTCPFGWVGNPQVVCYKPECKVDNDCPYNKACISENCVNPCSTISCGRGAECTAQNHRAQCQCPPGTQGDPLLACITGQCQYNEDCADHEACDRLNRICRPVCDEETCAATARCVGQNHQPKCSCPIGTIGDPFIECKLPVVKPVCTIDADCPSQLGCINELCLNPCHQGNMCSIEQECRVLDTTPMRTVICACPPDQILDSSGHCRTIVRVEPQCRLDSDCGNPERCYEGNCVDACRLDTCGVNAICRSANHLTQCSCPLGYIGNPRLECTLQVTEVIPRPECRADSECTLDKACRNGQCVNPCRADKPCGSNAFCSVSQHQPVCRCPEGYIGRPEVECLAPRTPGGIDCTTNSDCPLSEFCLNKLCINPCNCGPNSDCRVDNHYATCFCKAGYSGDPQTGCFKLGCQSDNECADNLQCYNQQCINPCILSDPCAREAECFGSNHKANCKCPSGYSGDPFVRCERLECYSHQDCPNDKACLENRCVNPCSPIANPPCAHNAECYPQNHAASCVCPENLPEGNPLAYCLGRTPTEQPLCVYDSDCPSKLACIKEQCVNPCEVIAPCHRTATCSVIDTTPMRTMACTCREGWVPNDNGECQAILIPIPPGCSKDDDCPNNEACINRICRNPCDCGVNAICEIRNHKPICSCKEGFEGNPNIFCRTIGCRIDSECDSGTACINGQCVNPCLVKNPCATNAECFVNQNQPECRCHSGYRGNPYERCVLVGCVSNSECPDDRQCINAQCINPCLYDNPCSPRAECLVQNHMALCKCQPGFMGNPYVDCKPEEQPECREDGDCPALLACLNNRCQNPCAVIEPCQNPAKCQVVNSLPVRTMNCVCPPGYISSGSGTCKPVTAIVKAACTSDSECPSERACFNGICRNPCNCGPNADCFIKNHKPICACKPEFEGNPELECRPVGCRNNDDCSPQHSCINRQCVPVCLEDNKPCGDNATCYGNHHRAICECLPGRIGNPRVACVLVGCRSDSECPATTACINNECKNPCVEANPCDAPAECKTFRHITECVCPPGTVSDGKTGCSKPETGCTYDRDCQSGFACIGTECVNPCLSTEPCGTNTVCKVVDTEPVRTMLCECLPGYHGNAAVKCDKVPAIKCRTDKGYVVTPSGECVCPPDTALNENDDCVPCPIEKGLTIDERGRCVCALERGLIIDERGNCVCPVEYGYRLDVRGNCVPVKGPECETDDDCPDHKYCNPNTKTCDNPCATKKCGLYALCNATNHQAICQCIAGYTGNPEKLCNSTSVYRTDFPKPEMLVSCLSDGVQVEILINEREGFNGVLYVKGHSKDEQCRRVLTLPANSQTRTELFKVQFGNCGLIHVNGKASFVLVIQKHPKLVTYKAQAYHIQCVYQTGEQNVTLGFNVSMLTTAGTIANTGPPPTCIMKIVTPTGQEINSAEIGDSLILQVDVQPGSIYGGFARSCVAKTMEDAVENEYLVTDENGCATDPSIFGEWSYNPDTQSLLSTFHAFKFPSSDNIRFQCNIRVCFGRCQPVNCRGSDAFGRRKRAVAEENDVADPDNLLSGQLREEITIQSNAILTLERREERYTDTSLSPDAQRSEDICVSMIGFIIALIITALLALVAVAVAVSCWLMAYRRRPKSTGPLPHPPEFPNPLFTTPEPMAEPSPDYLT